jgi:hypothetical protein
MTDLSRNLHHPALHKMSIIPNPNTPQLKAIDTYLKSLVTFDFAVLKTLTTDDYHIIMAPASMGVPAKTKDEDLARLEKVKESVKGEELKVSYDSDGVPLVLIANLLDSLPFMMSSTGWERHGSMYYLFFPVRIAERPDTNFTFI